MAFKKWVISSADKELAKSLAEECDIDPFIALLATGRGYSDPCEIEQFLSDEVMLNDPFEMTDIVKAAECINNAIAENLLICIYGDYDCDGVTATALLYDYLTSREARVIYYIPDRLEEGYGMNTGAIDKINGMGANLIITVDNGIVSVEEIAYAYALNMKVVVTDHHIPQEVLPKAEAVVDPYRRDCPSSFKEICGVAVAFKLACVLENKSPEELLERYSDLVTIGTIADVMPVTYENRSIVKEGIKAIKKSPRIGISAILNVAGIDREALNSVKLAFSVIPRLNAAGRMGNAKRAVELLISDNMLEALKIANEIDIDNSKRQAEENKILEQAIAIIEKKGYFYNRVIVVESQEWHHGIVGIVASRITERYGRPSIILSVENGIAKGSGRSYSGFSLFDAISSCKDLLEKFGGHELAAGISLETKNIEEFRKSINEYAACADYPPVELKIDCRLNPAALSIDLAESLQDLEPFGNQNTSPLFGVFGVTLSKITPIGNKKHLRLIFTKGSTTFQALIFGVSPDKFCFEIDDVLDLAVSVDTNLYMGNVNLSVTVKALRMSGTDDDRLFYDFENYNDFICGNKYDKNALLPTREEVGAVYKFISSKKVSDERIKYYFLNSVGYGKTMVAIAALKQLRLIGSDNSGLLTGIPGVQKTDLRNSSIYKRISEGSDNNEPNC